jgi:ribosomal protein S18 acetylase RimI-like enzyme
MDTHALDNPIWSSLVSHHARFARGGAELKRYPREMAPFVGLSGGDASLDTLADLVDIDELIDFVGVLPSLDTRWQIEVRTDIVQTMYRVGSAAHAVRAPEESYDVRTLSSTDTTDMLALTALTFPGYFRPRTPEMGTYIGVHDGGRLIAMAGERMHFGSYREMSAVCTHPDYLGRGLAGMLIRKLLSAALERGETPFLHVNTDNTRARSLYERLGFVDRKFVPLLAARRIR